MKKQLYLFILFAGVSLTSYGQKNIFTVPVADIVEKGKFYVQPGATISDQLALSGIFTYGIGSKLQAGITIKDLTYAYKSDDNKFPYEKVDPADNPDILANVQTGFNMGDNFKVGLGTQSGANIAGNGTDFSSFNYLNLQANFSNNKLILGTYYGNDTYVVTGNNSGILAGVEIPLGGDNIKLLGDYLSGTNARSVINLGLGIKLSQKWKMAIGAQLPSPNSGNSHGGVIQFNN